LDFSQQEKVGKKTDVPVRRKKSGGKKKKRGTRGVPSAAARSIERKR